jgi:hypothetical protein
VTALAPAPAAAAISPAQILMRAVDLLQARGRSYGSYDDRCGQLCALGAMAVAAGKEADCWEGLHGAYPHWLEQGDAELIEAARLLAAFIDDEAGKDELLVEELVGLIGDWHDGPLDPETGKHFPPMNSAVFDALTKAAHFAEQAVART